MGVKFQNENPDSGLTRGPHRKAIVQPGHTSQSPEKKSIRSQSRYGEGSASKTSESKYKDMSKHIYGKLERRKRKYKKKQTEYIGWYYQEINDTKIRETIDIISVMMNTPENQKFYEYLFNTAYMQNDTDEIDMENYNLVNNVIAPVLLETRKPILLNQAVKSLFLLDSYKRI